jgi:uncharacterized protein with NAD-binding domain and iron-sulfur cluster
LDVQPEREKVAVLGGGPAAMAAAFELTATPELRERYEVTVYQPGWRLGGKCASGRNMGKKRGRRIEEHGLHVWFGFYENALTLMVRAYEELKRDKGLPLSTFEKAFHECDESVLYDRQDGQWVTFAFTAPKNQLRPGEKQPLPTFWDIAKWVCEWALRDFSKLPSPGGSTSRRRRRPARARASKDLWDGLAAFLNAPVGQIGLGGEDLLRMALELAVEAQRTGTDALPRDHMPTLQQSVAPKIRADIAKSIESLFVSLLVGFRDWLWTMFETPIEEDPQVRMYFTMFDTFASATAGIVEDGVLASGWEAINQYDLCEWLARHGAKQPTLGKTPAERAPVLRSIYDVAFAYPEGKIENANAAAGTAMNDFLRLSFSYRGSIMYKMQAGMGETVLMPFYDVLKKRQFLRKDCVQFKFFHAVTGLHLSPDQTTVEAIDVVEQVGMKKTTYQPIVKVKKLDCWPSEPLWEQIPGGTEFQKQEPDFEGEADPLRRGASGAETLTRGRDFHHIVLAIPVGALPPLCTEIVRYNRPFARMLQTAVTVETQAFQLWLAATPQDLGWTQSQNSVAGCYVEPIDTWCDMTHLLPCEEWKPRDGVAGLAYFCGVLCERVGENQAQANERVKQHAGDFLANHIGPLWPKSRNARGGFIWEVLADPAEPLGFVQGPARLGSQYFRANVSLSERYVLTPKGTIKDRLRAGESGITNLYLAGDWTRNGIDGGCVEAAMASGIQAARSLAGIEREVLGEDDKWLSSSLPGAISMPPPLPAKGPPGASSQNLPVTGAPKGKNPRNPRNPKNLARPKPPPRRRPQTTEDRND